jgi:hypothetical protein
MNTYPEQAKAYTEAFKLGAVSLNDLVEWTDTVIAKEAEPTYEFIELSLCKKDSDALTCLESIAENANEERSYKILFGILHQELMNGGCTYEDVAKRLYFWSAYETEMKGYGDFVGFWDELGLAESGQHGNPEQVKSDILAALQNKMA